jgi:flagellar hook-associated protein 1 FlgK
MYSTFFGLEIAYRALASQQGALDVAGHNIANSNTPGYTRQVANLTATIPLTISASGKPLTMGSGSDLNNISRARDYFIDRQYRWENSKYQYWSEKSDSLTTVESLLNEPSDDSLNNDMSQFWSAWSELAKNPENSGARSVVKERAITLVDTFHNISQQISDMQKDLDSSVSTTVQRINTIADQIKELNVQIKQSEVRMDNANDLKDQRDALIDELSQYVPVRVIETQDPAFTDRVVGNVKIVIGDDANPDENILVDDQAANHLKETTPTTGFGQVIWDDGDSDTTNDVALSWGSNLHMGKLQADLEARDTDLKNYSDKIDTLAQGIAAAVNALHQDGQGLTHSGTGIDFFVSSTSDPLTLTSIR